MPGKHTVWLALAMTVAAPVSALAIGGAPGCSNLPEYDRAVGTLQGLSTCDMTIEQARRIVAGQSGGSAAYQQSAPETHVHHRRYQNQTSQP